MSGAATTPCRAQSIRRERLLALSTQTQTNLNLKIVIPPPPPKSPSPNPQIALSNRRSRRRHPNLPVDLVVNPQPPISKPPKKVSSSTPRIFTYQLFMNGFIYKDPNQVVAEDFFFMDRLRPIRPKSSNPTTPHTTKILQPDDGFVFPIGLIPFQANMGKTNVVALVSLSSQNLGVMTIANAIIGLKPPISNDILAKAF
ncbi:hypothetical protein ACLOJK_023311 [Asimina triloba]